MMRVLHVVPNLVPYGLQRMVAILAARADRSRFEISIVSLYDEEPGSLAAQLQSEGVRVFHLGKRRGLDVRMFGRIAKVLRQVRPDIIHTHNYVLRYTLPATLAFRTRLAVHTIHNVADHEVDGLGVWLQRHAFRGAVHPVVIAESAAESFERVYRMPRPALILNGIEVARYSRPRAPRENGDVRFVCVARFFPQKNHRDLLAAFAAGPARMPHCRLWLAGDGYLRPELEQQARELGIAAQVEFLGRREDVAGLLAECDVFVLASLWEGNPLSVMEAMAAGLPVVVTAAGGVPELVESETHGMVVAPGDVPALAEAMLRVARDPALRQAMGDAGAAHARARFDYGRMVEDYEALYEQLMPPGTGTARKRVQGGADACPVS